jgi:hypothetical protein
MSKFTGFISHAFGDELYDGGTAAFRAAVQKLFERVETVLSNRTGDISVRPYFAAENYGRELPVQIRRQLRECDFLIADLSAIEVGSRVIFNENVLFEVGYAMAIEIPVFFVRSKKTKALPSDVKDILAGSYGSPSEIADLLEAQLAQTLARLISSGGSRANANARLSQTWFDASVTTINVICTPEPERSRFASESEPNYLFVDNLEDRDALLEVSTFLARQYPKANIIRHSADKVPPDALNGNLVVLGGPGIEEGEGNKITQEMMRALKSSVRYSADFDGLEYLGEPYRAESRPDKSISTDWGCIIAAKNPMNSYARVVVFHGIYTFGTLAAALALSDLPNAMPNHLILEDADVFDAQAGAHNFEAVFCVPVVAGRVSAPKLERALIRRI